MGWRGGLRGRGRKTHRYDPVHVTACPHQLTKERSDCSVDPRCSKYVGQSDVEGVLCAGLQSHDVEETAISHKLVGRVEGAVNEDSDIYGVLWVGQVELHTHTAHWDVNRVQFRGRSSNVGRGWWVVRKERETSMRECDRMGAFYCAIHWTTHKGL